MDFKTRRIAKKYSILSIKNGQFVISNNIDVPNYLRINNDKVFRVNVIGTIIDKIDFGGKFNLSIDDGDKITLRTFKDLDFSIMNIGDVVQIIGRPRQSNNDVFIAVETISKIDAKWNNTRQKELSLFNNYYDSIAEPIPEKVEPKIQEQSSNLIEEEESIISNTEQKNNDPKAIYTSITSIIESLDNGDGANFIDVLNKLKESNFDLEKAEMMINKMILDGDIFEIQGNLKLSH